MTAAPLGAEVSLYYDAARPIQVDEFLQTPTGRTYRIIGVRIQQRGKNVGRQHLRAVVSDPAEITEGDVVRVIHWYARPASRTRLTRRGFLVLSTSFYVALFLAGFYYATNYVWISP
jgi:hypothetical protein